MEKETKFQTVFRRGSANRHFFQFGSELVFID